MRKGLRKYGERTLIGVFNVNREKNREAAKFSNQSRKRGRAETQNQYGLFRASVLPCFRDEIALKIFALLRVLRGSKSVWDAAPSAVACVKAHFAAVRGGVGCGEPADRFHDRGDLSVVGANAALECGQLGGQGLVVHHELAQADEGTDHVDAHFHCGGAVEDISGLDCAVFGKGEREMLYILTSVQGRILRP